MILIADSGSTKTHWCIPGVSPIHLFTQGFNPYVQTEEYISKALATELLPQLTSSQLSGLSHIHFYGTGCSSESQVGIVTSALRHHFKQQTIEVDHDLVAAARALCGHKPGIAAILGTGSNSCKFDGENITENIPGLGYVLGDDGAGSSLGKKLLRAYFFNDLPSDLYSMFVQLFKPSKSEILEHVYKQANPNRYLASFCPFLSQNIKHPFIHRLVYDSFHEFFSTQVSKYTDYNTFDFHCTGSIGNVFSEELGEVAGKFGMRLGKVLKSPMEGLIDFHS